ncbi:hypothetical protein [Shewanella xiamenensis]|uniref:hypothetical protein n=1 Tax=Shewanella xiamenensis TaxID=332186 RepID=UPI001F06EBC3|nr:hypothetical protein [Shewanella xiamenensis]UML94871.1 hypothetical protein MKD32_06050 [Shewanella xiamenensis]
MTTNHLPTASSMKVDAKLIDRPAFFIWLFVVLGSIAVLLLGVYFYHFWYKLDFKLGNQGDFGAFGDFLGGVLNPILGFATVLLLVLSLRVQAKELSLSRDELVKSSSAMVLQVSLLQKESEINELTRLLDRAIKNYRDSLNIQFPIFEIKIESNSGVKLLLNDTYSSMIHFKIPSSSPKIRKEIIQFILRSDTVVLHLTDLRRLNITIADLVVKYYKINFSKEFARVYVTEALLSLVALHQIFPSDMTQDRIQILEKILTGLDGSIALT